MLKREALELVYREVARTYFTLAAISDALHGPDGVSTGMRAVLKDLQRRPNTIAELAAMRPVSRQYMLRVVDQLQRRGLARYRPDERDRRARVAEITDPGRALLDAIDARERAAMRGVRGGFTKERLAGLARELSELRERMGERLEDLTGSRSENDEDR
ncbi:MAG: MarR family transcriptional regulator [Myxococcales bacterium FL481]|nr:MAG: MarR family transcriptional regulator [Myxococcales bacterium FL481]